MYIYKVDILLTIYDFKYYRIFRKHSFRSLFIKKKSFQLEQLQPFRKIELEKSIVTIKNFVLKS
ncbi:hypothetical protein BpHYR1_040031 [Brachionus plicatilis]|uniref:Uncharacterized protein n=1 Tax=Brachionus plicatilis TaxID=10195 RepID=A0A3M7T1C6_BRAPC|nr:hypothetical protein BpHYR1_040031 [Brachionus plicatilis]